MTREELNQLAREIVCPIVNELAIYDCRNGNHTIGCNEHTKTVEDQLVQLLSKNDDRIAQILAKAVGGFPWYKDDQKNFPGATEENGVCIGELTAEDLANLAEKTIRILRSDVRIT